MARRIDILLRAMTAQRALDQLCERLLDEHVFAEPPTPANSMELEMVLRCRVVVDSLGEALRLVDDELEDERRTNSSRPTTLQAARIAGLLAQAATQTFAH